MSKEAVEYAVNKLNLDVSYFDFKDFDSEGDFFDYICWLNVLEHTETPKITLKKFYTLLKPNWKLILSFPDFNGFEVGLYRSYAYTIQAPYYLYHFTPETIKKYSYDLNFKKIKIKHLGSTPNLVAPLGYVLQDNPDYKFVKILLNLFKRKIIRNIIIKVIINFMSYLGKTSRMTVIAVK